MSGKSRAAIRAHERARVRDARAAAALPKTPAVPKGATKAEAKKFDQLDDAAKEAQANVNEKAAEVPEKKTGLGKVTLK